MTSATVAAGVPSDLVDGGLSTDAPDVSLVVSTVGRPPEFGRLLDSIIAEISDDGPSMELIVVDQSRSEHTRSMLEVAELPFPWRHTCSGVGASLGRNIGLGLARARYVMFPDDDAWFPGTTLRAAVGHLDSQSDHDGFCTQLRDRDDRLSMLRWAPTARVVTKANHHRTSIGSTMLFRTDVARRSGGFDESMGPGADGWFGSCEDADFLLRIIGDGSTVWYDPATVMHHRDARRDGGHDAHAKSLSYGCGQGHMWRSHRFPVWLITLLMMRRFVGSLMIDLRGRPDIGKAHRAWVRGALNGYAGKPPMGLGPPDEIPGASASAPSGSEFGRSFSWRIAISPIGTIATFALTAVATRTLVDREVTVLYALLASLMIGPIIARFGLNQRAVQEIASARTRFEQAAAVGMARRQVRISLLPAAVAAPVVAVLFALTTRGAGGFAVPAVLASVILFTEALRLTISDVLTGLGESAWGAVLAHQIRAVAVILIVAVDMLVFPGRLDLERLLVIMVGTGALLVALGYQRLLGLDHMTVEQHEKRSLRTLLGLGLPFLVVDLVAVIVARGDVWLAARALSVEQAAFYSTASVLAVQVATPIGLASIALAPVIAGYVAQRRLGDLERLVRAVTTAAGCLMVPLVLIVIVFGDRLLAVAYGDRYAAAHLYLVVLMIGNLALTTLGTSAVVLMMSSRQRVAMTVSAIWFCVAAPVAVLAAYLGGPAALAVASASTTVGLYTIMAFGAWVRAGIVVFPYPRFWQLGALREIFTGGFAAPVLGAEGDDGT